jgi:deoxyadenosine/deoxycytidine kinase
LESDKIFIDIRTSELTLAQVIEEIERIQAENPDYEIFLDGDLHAIAGRKRLRGR